MTEPTTIAVKGRGKGLKSRDTEELANTLASRRAAIEKPSDEHWWKKTISRYGIGSMSLATRRPSSTS